MTNMSHFFFISTYDKITAELLTSLINIHPDIECKIQPDNHFFPSGITGTLDDFMIRNKSSEKKISGSIRSVMSYDLYNRILTEKTRQPFKKVNIMLSPISRVRLIMHSWLESGLPPEQILEKLNEEIMNDGKEKGLLSRYYVMDYYQKYMLALINNVKEVYKAKVRNGENPSGDMLLQKLFNLGKPVGMLFVYAIALVVAFDSADLPMTGKKYSFETLVTDENVFLDFIQYITNKEVIWTEEHRAAFNQKLEEVGQRINDVLSQPWEDWQEAIVRTILNDRFNIVCGSHVNKPLIDLYEAGGYHFAKKPPITYSKLISIQLNSCRPVQLFTYFDNIEETTDNPQEVEVLVNIDRGDMAMKSLLESEIPRRKFTIKYIESPKPASYFDLWKPLNELLKITDPNAYFLLNVSDEMLFITKGWDTVLKKYVGFFPDHIFRLRLSRNKFRNYFDRWECNFAQDSCPITTKRWIDIGGDWNPCFGPDSFQQLVSFYLAKEGEYINDNYLRDVPILDIKLEGDIPELGNKPEKKWDHIRKSIKAMLVCQSYKMQQEARRRAILLKAHMYRDEKSLAITQVHDNKWRKRVEIRMPEGIVLHTMSYKLSWFKIALTNQWRKIYLGYYFCNIVPVSSNMLIGALIYLVYNKAWCYALYRIYFAIKQKVKYVLFLGFLRKKSSRPA